MEFSSLTLMPGDRFCPYDEELVQYYLYPKVTNPLFTTSTPVRDCDIYAYQPLQIWNAFHRIHGEDVFFFTNLKKEKASPPMSLAKLPMAPQHGAEKTVMKTSLSLLTTISPSLPPGKASVIKAVNLTTMAAAGQCTSITCHPFLKSPKQRRHAGGVDDATNTTSQKARVGDHQGYDQQQITTPAESTESGILYNGVRFDNLESFSHAFLQDFDNDQMVAASIEQEDYCREILGTRCMGPTWQMGSCPIQTTPEADANPSCLVQENEVEMICNSLPMEYPYGW
ncbi:FACTOR putative-RELATED [Salix purpurea]|uniref:FACTOR putative-RELATED n=1 Tax=Salix purpurea TaxID=77065 RepID=A0A9Q0SRS6_SALPP|nr:FACTOR putative-RELATED [Salix purpurea]